MAIADELTKLEANRANIVAAINSKGGELAENAGLAACPEAISQLSGAGGATLWTGHVDEAGLRYIGWDDADIANLKANICWDEEDDELYAVPQDHKDLWDSCEKVVVNGRTMLEGNGGISAINAIANTIKYFPKIDSAKLKVVFSSSYTYRNLIALPALDLSLVEELYNSLSLAYNLLYLNLELPNCTNLGYCFSGNATIFNKLYIDAPKATNAAFLLNSACAKQCYINIPSATVCSRTFRSSRLKDVKMSVGKNVASFERSFDSIVSSCRIILFDTQFTGVVQSNGLIAPNSSYKIPLATGCDYTAVKSWLEAMVKGIPNYTADSYPMYFESGSTVDDDAAGTLQSLVEQCQAMGWAIYNLTINPYTE